MATSHEQTIVNCSEQSPKMKTFRRLKQFLAGKAGRSVVLPAAAVNGHRLALGPTCRASLRAFLGKPLRPAATFMQSSCTRSLCEVEAVPPTAASEWQICLFFLLF